MKVYILQTDIVWDDPAANVRNADEAMDKYTDGDLFVLPEMFSTGFCTEPEGIAEPSDNETVKWMVRKAAERGCAIAGSIAIVKDGHYYNRFHFVHPDGRIDIYDKRHLFTYGGEDKRFTAGAGRTVVEHRGVRILLQICYDLRFPVFARNRGDYDMIIYVANWPVGRVDVWKLLLRARALENQCYVVGVNRVGDDPYCKYVGGSAIVDAYGKTVAECADGQAEEASAEIDLDKLKAFRNKFPVLDDADKFTIDD